MSDMSLMDNLNDLKKPLIKQRQWSKNFGISIEIRREFYWRISEFYYGKKVYLNRIDATEKDSCQYEKKPIDVLKGIDKEMLVSIQAGDIAVNLKNKALEKNNTKNAYAW